MGQQVWCAYHLPLLIRLILVHTFTRKSPCSIVLSDFRDLIPHQYYLAVVSTTTESVTVTESVATAVESAGVSEVVFEEPQAVKATTVRTRRNLYIGAPLC